MYQLTKQWFSIKLAAVATILVATSCGRNTEPKNQTSNLAEANETRVVCDASNLPDGVVIVGHVNSIDCRTSPIEWNAYQIKRAGDREVVCADSPIPRGYVKERTLSTGNCGISFRDNAYSIFKM